MTLPDPFASETRESASFSILPLSVGDYQSQLSNLASDLYLAIDSCLKNQGPVSAITSHKEPFTAAHKAGNRLDRRIYTATVMMLIESATKQGRKFETSDTSVAILKALLADFEPEGESTA